MDLPIDHFRLLGVPPSMDAQGVLRTLQLRLDRVPHAGFTPETLQERADLLRASADLLSDEARRAAYETDLTRLSGGAGSLQPALEITSSRQLGGLLLLLEGGQPLDCFEMVTRCLQPPQAPSLGSGREADLTLLAGLSCQEAARELTEQRRFEAAARALQQGLQLLQRLGKRPELREAMHLQLEQLTPYRVLDLLSRDLVAAQERSEGLALLQDLVQRRGGLEGDGDPLFPQEDFQPFFHQIRGFLTVQEQVDLFSSWGDAGSEAADFLATIALTASGFAQRKPERIAAARDRLQRSGRAGIEPLLANLHLLLGEADAAKVSFEQEASQELREWAASRSPDPLGQLCAYCSDWLARDVLPGYRDLEAESDLVAYFSDRDVVAYVEREDRRRGRAYAAVPPSAEAIGGGSFGGFQDFSGLGLTPAADLPVQESDNLPGPGTYSLGDGGVGADDDGDGEDDEEVELGWHLPSRPWLVAGGTTLVLLLLAGWFLRHRPAPPSPPTPSVQKPAPPAPVPPRATPVVPPSPAPPAGQGIQALTAANPSEAQVRELLTSWLTVKGAVLGGEAVPPDLNRIAREGPIALLTNERGRDAARGETQRIDVRITDLSISERDAGRLVAVARLRYSDRRLDAAGKELERTPPTDLRNGYVFGRDGDSWRLVATRSLN